MEMGLEVFGKLVEAVEVLLEKVREVRERQRLLGEEIEAVREAVQGLRRCISELEEEFRQLQAEVKASTAGEKEEFFRAFTPGGGGVECGDSKVHGRVLERGLIKASHRPLEEGDNS
ncbi:MAG: hypothetical protein DRJ32_04990 [Thermoprotei archaeon]|nr:MAG: hypothetical protein DRJ32_04990 [Thermoprotei archaeon]